MIAIVGHHNISRDLISGTQLCQLTPLDDRVRHGHGIHEARYGLGVDDDGTRILIYRDHFSFQVIPAACLFRSLQIPPIARWPL